MAAAAEVMISPTWKAGVVAVMLISGFGSMTMMKMQLAQSSVGMDGQLGYFTKPVFATLIMFLSMSLASPIALVVRMQDIPVDKSSQKELAGELGYKDNNFLLCAFPAFLDLVHTTLSHISMLLVPLSVVAMLSGASIVFGALLSITLLKKSLKMFNWLGIACVVMGLAVVSWATATDGQNQPSFVGKDNYRLMACVGIVLRLTGCFMHALESIAQEWLCNANGVPPLDVVGYSGLCGTAMMCAVVLPLAYQLPGSDHGHLENPLDAVVLIWNSWGLMCCIAIYMVSVCIYNVASVSVCQCLSTNIRLLFEPARVILIWLFGILVHHTDPAAPYGEAWSEKTPALLLGFAMMVAGKAIYIEAVRVPGLESACGFEEAPLLAKASKQPCWSHDP